MVLWNFDSKKPVPQQLWEKSNTRLTLVCNPKLSADELRYDMKELDSGWTVKRRKKGQIIYKTALEGGLEPPTLWLTATRSNQLSYSSTNFSRPQDFQIFNFNILWILNSSDTSLFNVTTNPSPVNI